MDEKLNLNDLVVSEGEEFNESTSTIKRGDDADLVLDSLISNGPIPGQTAMPTSNDVALNKEEAVNDMVVKLAANKLQKEVAEYKKLSDNERIRNYVFETEFYRHTNAFFTEHGFEMTGQQKRVLKHNIERAWKKGKYKLTPEQKDDILFELNKASNEKEDAAKQALGGKERVDSLAALTTL